MTTELDGLELPTLPPEELVPERLAGKRILVWGAGTHGGGLAAATWCDRAGARVAILDRRPPRELPEVMAEVGKRGWPWHLGEARHPAVRNCDLIVASPAIPPAALASLPPDAAPVVCPEALCFAVHRGARIAVTGTKGKSTTAAMCGTLLDWAVGGNSHQPLLDLLRAYGPSAPLVCELSSFQLWHLRAFKPRFTLGLMTSLHRDHIDWHGSEAHYRASKLALLDWCDAVVLPPELAAISDHHPVLETEVVYRDGVFVLPDGRQVARREHLPLPGEHNAANAALALTAAIHLGLDPTIVGIRLTQVSPLPHRLQPIHASGDLVFVDDSIATTPEATIAGLAACHGPLAVILGGADKGADYAALATAVAGRGARAVCLGKTGGAIRDLLLAQGIDAPMTSDMTAAVRTAVDQLGGHGTVLLSPACASTDMFADFAERGDRFAEAACTGWPSADQALDAACAHYADLV